MSRVGKFIPIHPSEIQSAADLDLALAAERGAVGVGNVSEGRCAGCGATAEIREMGGVGVGGVVVDDVSNWINRSYVLMVEDVEGLAQTLKGHAVVDMGAAWRRAHRDW